jgi:DNA-binding response OmpR family regulator
VGPSRQSPVRDQRTILIVDDDPGTCETFGIALRADGYGLATACSGREALEIARTRSLDLAFVDQRLPDMLGTDVVRALNRAGVPFVLMSAFLTTEITVEAMRLGAVNVLEKPAWIEVLRGTVSAFFQRQAFEGAARRRARPSVNRATSMSVRPASLPERWALHVIKGCESDEDLTSLQCWAAAVGTGRTTIAETCRLLGIHPPDARDLTRVLRAIVHAQVHGCAPAAMLLVSDGRTLDTLFGRAGFAHADAGSVSADHFLANQRFVSPENEGLKALRRMLAVGDPETGAPHEDIRRP